MVEAPIKKAKRAWRFKAVAILVLIGAASAVSALILTQRSDVAAERSVLEEEQTRGPRVEIATASPGPREREIRLFSDARPYQEVTLYAKVSGYIKTINVDKGTMVKAGQLIAEVASPETDAQYSSTLSDLSNKKQLAERADRLYKIGAVSREVAEQAQTNYEVAQATASQLETLRSYERLTAPFDGRVTARYADPGALVQNATNSQSSALPVVTISDASHLRVDAYVQQQDAPFVHVGDVADVVDAANPGRRITARVSRTSGQLDPRTRTLLVEIDVANAKDFFVGGSFAYVTLHLAVPPEPQVPVNALVLRDNKQYVAVPDNANVVHFRPIELASTDGGVVRIASGLKPGETVVLNVPDEIVDGSHIQPIAQLKN
ncbi:MAG TPA: efflux RND transporter periplasmic adaptor subunit [Micropepsaceae bacterium]|nr:efflux RND transporter periplasmic adaptor subunit [Micropepsaceae bacterium]